MKHYAVIAAGEPADLEQQIRTAVALRGGTVTSEPIGGSARWNEPPGLPWQLDWIRLVQPRGLRIDLYADETVSASGLGEELWQGIFGGRVLPIVVGGTEIREQPSTTSGGTSTTTTSGGTSTTTTSGGAASSWGSSAGGALTTAATSTELPSSGGALLAGAIVSGVVASGAGFALWKCRKRRKCRARPWVVAGLVVSTVVGLGFGTVLALRGGGA